MRELKRIWLMFRMYRVARFSKFWAVHSSCEAKRGLCEAMYDVNMIIYNKVKPRWFPLLRPIEESDLSA